MNITFDENANLPQLGKGTPAGRLRRDSMQKKVPAALFMCWKKMKPLFSRKLASALTFRKSFIEKA